MNAVRSRVSALISIVSLNTLMAATKLRSVSSWTGWRAPHNHSDAMQRAGKAEPVKEGKASITESENEQNSSAVSSQTGDGDGAPLTVLFSACRH